MIKVGTILWEIWAEDDTGKINTSEYVVRSIRKGRVNATLKASWTWGKRSKKHGDFGWLDPISPEWRKSWPVEDSPAGTLATTRKTALIRAIALHKKYGDPSDYSDPEMFERITKTLSTMLKKERNKGKAK